MKKLLLLAAGIMLCDQLASADYRSMLVRTASGQSYTVALDDIRIAIADGNLKLSNNTTNVSVPLDELTSMEFSDMYSSLTDIYTLDGSCELFSVSGQSLGKFEKISDALENLPAGVYVIKTSQGITRKFSVAK